VVSFGLWRSEGSASWPARQPAPEQRCQAGFVGEISSLLIGSCAITCCYSHPRAARCHTTQALFFLLVPTRWRIATRRRPLRNHRQAAMTADDRSRMEITCGRGSNVQQIAMAACHERLPSPPAARSCSMRCVRRARHTFASTASARPKPTSGARRRAAMRGPWWCSVYCSAAATASAARSSLRALSSSAPPSYSTRTAFISTRAV